MRRHHSSWKRTSAVLVALAATTWAGKNSHSQTSYEFVNPANVPNPDWLDSNNWDPMGIPSLPGDEAIFTRPTVTPSEDFLILLPGSQDTTVGSILIDSTNFSEGNNFVIDGGHLIFQAAFGSASYTETESSGNTGRISVFNDITVMSDLIMTHDHRSELNSSSLFFGLMAGASDRTITKEGIANLQLSLHGVPGGFEGQYVINEGGIRFTGSANFDQSSGVTVNSGGQLQLDSQLASPTKDWSLADGAVLNLNGLGKEGGSAASGAMRFQGRGSDNADTHVRIHSPVVLQSDTGFSVGPATVTGELTNVVSGAGGLVKAAPGILAISNPGSSYAGDTTIQQGTLSFTNAILADAADVFLTSGTALDLNFTGTDVVDSLFIDGESQAVGTWGAVDNLNADFQSELITGSGLLEVSTLDVPGLPGDYNDDGVVDAADYTVWRDNLGSDNPLGGNGDEMGASAGVVDAADYALWVSSFGNVSEESSLIASSVVPEPGTLALAVVGMMLAGWTRQRRA